MTNSDLMLLSVITVVLFCASSWVLIHSIRAPIPALNVTGYSKRALQIKKNYSILSWSIMTLFLLGGLVMSFYQVFTEL